jgi:hypothetical protein
MHYLKQFGTRRVPQWLPLRGQAPNSAGGHAWAIDVWTRLRRFPAQALREYRRASGIDARLVVVGMVSNCFSIADPGDPGMLDVVGFHSATPQLISDFARGAL